MASPQLEHGFVRIANTLIEEFARREFSSRERRVLDVVLRETYGMNRKSGCLSSVFIANRTGLDPSHVRTTLRRLVRLGVLLQVEAPSFKSPGTYAFVKDFDTWQVRRAETAPVAETARGAKSARPEGPNRPLGLGRQPKNGRRLRAPKDTMKDTMSPPSPPGGGGGGGDLTEVRLRAFQRRLQDTLALSGLSERQLRTLQTFLDADGDVKRKARALDRAIAEVQSKLATRDHGIQRPVDLALKRAGEMLAEPEAAPESPPAYYTAPPARRAARIRDRIARLETRLGGQEPSELDLRDLEQWRRELEEAELEAARC